MKREKFTSGIRDLISLKNSWRNIAFIAIIVDFFMVFAVISVAKTSKTVITPPMITKGFWIESGKVDPNYIRQMSNWFASLVLTTSPGSVEFQNRLFLSYVTPTVYGALRARLDAEASRLQKGNISQVFYQRDIYVIKGKMESAVVGRKVTYIGKTETNSIVTAYDIKFGLQNGRIVVLQFKEANPDDPFGIRTREANAKAKAAGETVHTNNSNTGQ